MSALTDKQLEEVRFLINRRVGDLNRFEPHTLEAAKNRADELHTLASLKIRFNDVRPDEDMRLRHAMRFLENVSVCPNCDSCRGTAVIVIQQLKEES
jgi:hypothetical protein